MSARLIRTKWQLVEGCAEAPRYLAIREVLRTKPLPIAWAGLAVALFLISGCGRAGPAESRPADRPVGADPAWVVTPREHAPPAPGQAVVAELSGPRLFTQYCAACHGENGDGNGPAARFLYPKPRNLREGQFRLVTTTNRIPSDEDLMRVVVRGMPGSAMFPMGHLGEVERKELVTHVRSLIRGGLEDRLRREAKEFGEEVVPDELAKTLDTRTRPGQALNVPTNLPAPSPESVARGRALYLKQCATCHGNSGKGDGVQEQRDESGMPTRPRDFTRGVFKGGREREQLYARIMLGVPGTPMPASLNFKPEEVGELINFIQSLSDSSTPAKVEHRRSRIMVIRSSETLSESIPESQWTAVTPTSIVVSPLWWRDFADPDLRVQALHDGKTLAIRLSWRDETRDAKAIRPQEFPDMAAIQLFKGDREPFLGMGSAGGGVDIWLWNAAAQADQEEYADVDTTYPNMAVDQYPLEERSAGPRAHPTARQPKQFITAWAAGNPRSDPSHALSGSNLEAKGFGTLSFRPRISQVTSAHGRWQEGRWTIVLRRVLKVSSEAGLELAGGDRCSIALAVWDGAARDRDGQKLVSIWHDLELR
jgi:DMSO reductase family type II enzyme heme b subunit